jgi:hypothetical protein
MCKQRLVRCRLASTVPTICDASACFTSPTLRRGVCLCFQSYCCNTYTTHDCCVFYFYFSIMPSCLFGMLVFFFFLFDSSLVNLVVQPCRDALDNPTRGGIYDPRLGPIDSSSICETCHLSEHQCPGHLGKFNVVFVFSIVGVLSFVITVFITITGHFFSHCYCYYFKTCNMQ